MRVRSSPLPECLALISAVLLSGCFKAWDVGGPWACSEGSVCPDGFSCDEGVCCKPGGTPACPTLPVDNKCPNGGEPTLYFQDADGDGDGNEKVRSRFCRKPRVGAWVTTSGDCDDTRGDLHSAAAERCNGLDDNCNGVLDDNLAGNVTFYRDDDGDLFGDDADTVPACMAPPGYAAAGGDCAPFDPGKKPGAPELCNNLDDDCDGQSDVLEPAFADTDDAVSQRFPCLVQGAVGVCRAGTFRCQPMGSTVQRVCVPLQSPSREVCDGLDNDCDNTDGGADEQPECGGPVQLLAQQATLRYRAQRLPSSTSAQLNGSCQANRTGGTAETLSADGRVWSGGTSTAAGEYYHVWSVEAPNGQPWDLSRLDAVMRLAFDATFAPYNSDAGVWGIPPGDGFYPVVYLCGETDDQYIRYRIIQPGDALTINDMSFDQVLPLNSAAGSRWLVGTGSGFDTARVRRVEVMLFTRTSSFTVTFRSTTGFQP